MDFTFTDDQRALASLAADIFGAHATPERLKEIEAGDEGFDRALWEALRRADLLDVGSSAGGGFVEQCVVLVEQGKAVAPVPLWSHYVGSWALGGDAHGIVTVGIDDVGAPAMDLADTAVAVVGDDVLAAVSDAVRGERNLTTHRQTEFRLSLEAVSAERLSVPATLVRERAATALCALAVGVAERALRITADYTSQRHQFERPLASFQAVQQRAADAFVDVECMRWTMWNAAWRLEAGADATDAVRIAKFFCAESGQRVAAATQHLHGGIGVDTDYPIHRYTRWAKYLELCLGGAAEQLTAIGASLARGGA